ncbi:hypothetical protein PanWU01x14_135180 [Parasponia andersonii]|uniref:Uncharacterized protein n=1 Tax=Parasponia andersonii TaxID=3476 RepID=A0A2P5CP91_PARAD|nr:hypothetical protein PanWU01x14_135180 [Parasponia andersonii]
MNWTFNQFCPYHVTLISLVTYSDMGYGAKPDRRDPKALLRSSLFYLDVSRV